MEERHDLWQMYYEFGPNEAIATHPDSMSYVVQLAPGYRLFALNDDTNYKPEGRAAPGTATTVWPGFWISWRTLAKMISL